MGSSRPRDDGSAAQPGKAKPLDVAQNSRRHRVANHRAWLLVMSVIFGPLNVVGACGGADHQLCFQQPGGGRFWAVLDLVEQQGGDVAAGVAH